MQLYPRQQESERNGWEESLVTLLFLFQALLVSKQAQYYDLYTQAKQAGKGTVLKRRSEKRTEDEVANAKEEERERFGLWSADLKSYFRIVAVDAGTAACLPAEKEF